MQKLLRKEDATTLISQQRLEGILQKAKGGNLDTQNAWFADVDPESSRSGDVYLPVQLHEPVLHLNPVY